MSLLDCSLQKNKRFGASKVLHSYDAGSRIVATLGLHGCNAAAQCAVHMPYAVQIKLIKIQVTTFQG